MIWPFIATVGGQVTLLALVALATAALIRSAAHRHAVLLACLLSILAAPAFYGATLLCGLSLPVPRIAVMPSDGDSRDGARRPSRAVRAAPAQPAVSQTMSAAPNSIASTAETESVGHVAGTAAPNPVPPQSVGDLGANWRLDVLVALLGGLGTLVGLAGIARSHGKVRALLRTVFPLDRAVHGALLAEAAERLGIGEFPRIGTTGNVAGPAVAGLIAPWVLIPARYLEVLSRAELRQVLIHEGAHSLRRDPLTAFLQRVAGAMFWWHPLVHFLNRGLSHAREEVCDNFVLRHTHPAAYGGTLLRLATLSPGGATLSATTGILGGRGKLEDRVQAILDSTRKTSTHVGGVMTVATLVAFAICSVLLSAARVTAGPEGEEPEKAPAPDTFPAPAPEANPSVDLAQFRLTLTYHGQADKPFYRLVLTVPPAAQQNDPSTLFSPIDEQQAARLVRRLTDTGFFEHARITQTQDDPESGPQYLLRVRLGEAQYEESLGWDPGTMIRLDGIRDALEGNPAALMDRLLERLSGLRREWESGEPVSGLRTTLSLDGEVDVLPAGRPIPIKVQLTNSGGEDRQFGQHRFIRSGSEIVVLDEFGRRVPYLGGGAGLVDTQMTIRPNETQVLEACDLSSYYYLRRPGRYAVFFRPAGLPPSNTLRLRVTPDAAGMLDGDPLGKLLPLNSQQATIVGSPNSLARVRPGRNRAEVPGFQFAFVDPVRGQKGSRFIVWLWLTEDAAADVDPQAEGDHLPASEHLGRIARWQAYFYASPEAREAWPSAKEDIVAALERAPERGARLAPAAPSWGEARHGLRTRVRAAKQVFEAGESIHLQLEIENVGTLAWKYQTPAAPHNGALVVRDDQGGDVPYLGGLSQVAVRLEELPPGQSREMAAFDLAESCYLRRPGRYSVVWPGSLCCVAHRTIPTNGRRAPPPPPSIRRPRQSGTGRAGWRSRRTSASARQGQVVAFRRIASARATSSGRQPSRNVGPAVPLSVQSYRPQDGRGAGVPVADG